MQLLPAAMQRKPPRRGALAQGGWGIAGQWPSCSAVLTDAGTDESQLTMRVCKARLRQLARCAPLPLANLTIV